MLSEASDEEVLKAFKQEDYFKMTLSTFTYQAAIAEQVKTSRWDNSKPEASQLLLKRLITTPMTQADLIAFVLHFAIMPSLQIHILLLIINLSASE